MSKKLLKKAVAMSLSFMMLPTVATIARADDGVISVEGENFIRASSNNVMTEIDENSSGGKNILIKDKASDFQYKIKVDKAGPYYMNVSCSPYNLGNVSTCKIRINDGEYKDISSYKPLETGVIRTNIMHKYKLQTPISLKKGVNSIYFRVDEPRTQDGRIWWYLDSMSFEKGEWAVTGMETNADNNIFEEKDEISAQLLFSNKEQAPHEVKYRVTDYYGNEILKKEDTIVNEDKLPLEFTTKPTVGYYVVYVSVDGKEETEYYFSVVKDEEKRNKAENTQFAIDTAASYFIPPSQLDGMVRSLRLAGVDYVRDRWNASIFNPEKDKYNLTNYNDLLKAYRENDIKVMPINQTLPTYMKSEDGKLPTDLLSVYDYSKTSAEYFGEDVSYEFWNEPDISGFALNTEPADKLAAYIKAMSIGVVDSGLVKEKICPGWAYPPGDYVDRLMQNDIMDYLDAYSYHGHVNWSMTGDYINHAPALDQNPTYAKKYGLDGKRWYITEAGLSTEMENKERNIPFKNQKGQARYIVTSMVETASTDADRHYYFMWLNYVEGVKQWGMFTADYVPFAAYNSLTTLTDVLGGADYYGAIECDGAFAHVFERDGQQIMCFWSENGADISVKTNAMNMKLVNLMGSEDEVKSENGIVNLTAEPDPKYLITDGKFENVNAIEQRELDPIITEFTKAQRVIITQSYPQETNEQSKITGYKIPTGEETEIKVTLTNLNNEKMTGTVKGNVVGGWKLAQEEQSVSIEPYQTADVTFKISGSADVVPDLIVPISFTATFDGEETSKSQTYIVSADEGEVNIDIQLPDFNNPEKWSRNIPDTMTMETGKTDDGGILFSYKYTVANTWLYPEFEVPSNLDLSDTQGMVIDIWVDDNIDTDSALLRLWALEDNGADYYDLAGAKLKPGFNRIKCPWSIFSVFSVMDDNFHLDTDRIVTIRAGMNLRTGSEASYKITNIGFYKQPAAEVFPVATVISPSDNAESGSVKFEVKIDENEIGIDKTKITVKLDGKVTAHKYKDGIATAECTLTDGEHTFELYYFDNNGKNYMVKKTFNVGSVQTEQE